MTLPEITERQNYSLICRKKSRYILPGLRFLNTRTKLEWLSSRLLHHNFIQSSMIPPYTAFLDGNTGIFLQQKMLSAAQITYSSEQFPLLGVRISVMRPNNT